MRQRIFLFFVLFYHNGYNQTLNPKQEQFVNSVISSQFGSVANDALFNMGFSSFCIIGADTFYNPIGYNYVFKLSDSSIQRLDHSLFHGHNQKRYLFSFNNRLYTLGGYGFFTTNNNLTYFNATSKEWCFEPTSGSQPPFISGIVIRQGDLLYSFNNLRSGNNVVPDTIDNQIYCLDLNKMNWSRVSSETALPSIPGTGYQLKDFYFFHGLSNSFLYSIIKSAYIIISNDEFGLAHNSYLTAAHLNTVEVSKKNNNGELVHSKLDLALAWKLKENKAIPLKFISIHLTPVKSGKNNLLYVLALAVILVTGVFIFLKRKGREKNESSEPGLNTNKIITLDNESELAIVNSLLSEKRPFLTVEELDELLKIKHLEPDSRKLKRHRILNEINKEHPNLIQRMKDKNDGRRFLYHLKHNTLKK